MTGAWTLALLLAGGAIQAGEPASFPDARACAISGSRQWAMTGEAVGIACQRIGSPPMHAVAAWPDSGPSSFVLTLAALGASDGGVTMDACLAAGLAESDRVTGFACNNFPRRTNGPADFGGTGKGNHPPSITGNDITNGGSLNVSIRNSVSIHGDVYVAPRH